MRFPSLLKIPHHKRFNLQPRYYDPIKEDIENRTDLMRSEMKLREKLADQGDLESYESRISGSFGRKTFYTDSRTGIRRFSIMLILVFTAFGYLFWGNIALFTLGGFLITLFLIRRLKTNRASE